MFCTEKNPKIKFFDKESDLTMSDWNNSEWRNILCNFQLTQWVCDDNMTDQEKTDHPKFHVRGGYLKTFEYKEAFKNLWDTLTDEQKLKLQEMPNFDKDKFEEITGVSV